MNLVTVTPAGRRRYLETLVPYLLRNRDVIREHRWWANTRDPHDLAYLHRLVDEHPDFFRIVTEPIDHSLLVGEQIWRYMRKCDEPETVYLRLDDDICYVDDGAIQRLYEFRLSNPEPFLALGLVVNNALSTTFFQRAGVVPQAWGVVRPECFDDVGWRDPCFAERLHRVFLADLRSGDLSRWRGVDASFDGKRRYSINAICWRGEDMALVEDRFEFHDDEERLMTVDLPKRFGRPTAVCADALFGHYAYYAQRNYLDRVTPELLDEYRRIAIAGDATRAAGPTAGEAAALLAQRARGKAYWAGRAAIHGVKRALKRAIGKTEPPEPPRKLTWDDIDTPYSQPLSDAA